ncbi:hypothetical protein JCM10908_000730 [Rhodotorula pacifica]|uniref:uncharacterized protein n=1 Tax=Rhodotorula pacifica TaxID=1495444 RepID=UPI00317C1E19
MANGAIKTAHSTSSIRARSRPDPTAPDRKLVYKPVVDNPLTVHWPPLPAPVRHAILQELLNVIADAKSADGRSLADWRLDQHALRRGNKRGAGNRSSQKEGTTTQDKAGESIEREKSSRTSAGAAAAPSNSPLAAAPPPALLSNLVVGINEVTRALESRIRWGRWELGDRDAAPPSSSSSSSSWSSRDPSGNKDEELASETTTTKGRKRKRRHASTANASASAISPPARPLGDHPAYSFIHDSAHAGPGRRARPPTPTLDAAPPYLVRSKSVQDDASSEADSASTAWRLLVNSDARRFVAKSKSTLLPAQPPTSTSDTDITATSSFSEPQPTPPPTVPFVDLVFVCKPDINPPSLVAHLPSMVAAANGVQTALDSVLLGGASKQEGSEGMQVDETPAAATREEGGGGQARPTKRPEMRPVLLVPLDVGAERRLADALGLRRVAAIGLSSILPATSKLHALLQSHKIQPLSTPWLVPYLLHPHAPPPIREPLSSASASRFAPTTIKHVKTSAPLNPRAGVQRKKEERKQKKEAIEEMRSKKRKVARDKARGSRDDGGGGDDVYVAED